MEAWLTPVYDAKEMGKADKYAIRNGGVSSLDLMEAAGRAIAEEVAALGPEGPIRVVCGKGNNGGDGLVAARHLANAGYAIELLLLWPPEELSDDAAPNFTWLANVEVQVGEVNHNQLARSGAIIDAMLGTGFSGQPREPVKSAIEAINASGCPVISCDVPSGVDASTGEALVAVEATTTVTFHAKKVGHLVNPGKRLCGAVKVAAIGIPQDAPDGKAAGEITDGVLDELPPRNAASTKFTSGRVSVVGGSKGLTGAVCLAAEAATRAGAGYATVAVPASLEEIFEIKLTEVMSLGIGRDGKSLGPKDAGQILDHVENASAVVLGSGMGKGDGVTDLVARLAEKIDAPLVIDADGLGALSGRLDSLHSREGVTLLTPHEGEAARLLETDSAFVAAHRLDSAKRLARESGSVVVLKGDDSIITDGERVAINNLASPALATAGTGDVLAGICGAFLGRGLDVFAAACAAVRIHTIAGRIAAERQGVAEAVIASDVTEALAEALAGRGNGSTGG